MPEDCFICRKHEAGDDLDVGVIHCDPLVFASHGVVGDRTDVYLGHVFVETKRHVAGLGELTDDEAAAVGQLVNDLAAALRRSEHAEHVYGHVYGDRVPHLHVHLVPRYPGAPPEYWTVRATDWPDAPRGDLAAVRAVSARLHDTLALIRSERTTMP
jgi:diadenosine tetraphosphate (Ap4A) HIT family hydrolase